MGPSYEGSFQGVLKRKYSTLRTAGPAGVDIRKAQGSTLGLGKQMVIALEDLTTCKRRSAGVELKRSPEIGGTERAAGVEQRKLAAAQRLGWSLSILEALIERVHETRR